MASDFLSQLDWRRSACARGYLTKGHVDDAMDLYNDVLKIDSDNALAYADHGTVFAMSK